MNIVFDQNKYKLMKNVSLILILFSLNIAAQSNVNYNDVAVIFNSNSPASIEIANYFKQKRNIPEINMIEVNTSTDEEINDSTFNDYLEQVKSYITSNNLTNTLNYLVTTKGCPLKVSRFEDDQNNCNASVESEFMLMLSGNESVIGSCTSFNELSTGNFLTNPYFQQVSNFSKSVYDIYLVTRLDAYTVEQVLEMIDKSGPNVYVNKSEVLFVLDQAVNFSGNPLNNALSATNSLLSNRNWLVLFNNDSVFVTDQENVMGYASWGSNDAHAGLFSENAKPRNTWHNGSLAETHVSTSARSFQPGTEYGQSLIADLIDEGVSGVKGYVYEPFVIAIASSDILFERYTRMNNQGNPIYNLAESFFSASRMISWKDVVIGDPKTSITTNEIYSSIHTPAHHKDEFVMFPNPGKDFIQIRRTAGNSSPKHLIEIMDLEGRKVYQSLEENDSINIDIRDLKSGFYIVNTVNLNSGKLSSSKLVIAR
jgi:uncharacterized protein (TIGR03790 family)